MHGSFRFLLLFITVLVLIHFESVSRVSVPDLYLKPSKIYKDRNGKVLRWVPDSKGERHIWTPLEKIPSHVQEAFISAEDQRFYTHPGVDIMAIIRAAKSNLMEGKIVSGASTITQQLSRLTYPRKRTYYDKFIELLRSLRIEGLLNKKQILELYLNKVPMGNNLVGIQAGTKVYFGKALSRITYSEAALLASLPKAPGKLNPYGGNVSSLLGRKNWVLKKMYTNGYINSRIFNLSIKDKPLLKAKSFPFDSPHFVNHVLESSVKYKTTIDLYLQRRVEQILKSHQFRLKRKAAHQASVVILENKNSEILSLAGSIEYSERFQGFNDGAQALRSPGSTLKPFLFAQALEAGLNTSTVLEDIEKKYKSPQGIYRPVNFNKISYGPVSLRNSLGNSLNQTAVSLLNKISYSSFYRTLKSLGLINFPSRGPDHYGLGMVIGNPEVTLVQLASAYAVFARGGLFIPSKYFVDEKADQEVRVFSEEASYILTDMLSDPSARDITFGDFFSQKLPFKVALKTGTSTNYRDSWIVGYTAKHTVAIWVGNFNGQPTLGLSGAEAAGPILFDILNELYPNGSPPLFNKPAGVISKEVCSYSGMKPGKFCPHVKRELFIAGKEPNKFCNYHNGSEGTHDLPLRFATWLHKKYRQGVEGNYRLAGFSKNLAEVFNKTGKLHTDRIKKYKPVNSHIEITSPVNGETFIMGLKEEPYEIELNAFSSTPIQKITWYLNGKEYDRVGPPYKTQWLLTRGIHTITATSPGYLGDSVKIEVR